ncbi:MAG: hypothetical protein ACKPKO_42170 [Candidatus Fonsibacter sp.]
MVLIVNVALHLHIFYNKGNINTNLTADRIDNDDDHNLCNIQPLCILCKSQSQTVILSLLDDPCKL